MLVMCNGLARAEDGFVSIFDGKTLDGWKAHDMSHWSVEDGAITGKTTADHPLKHNVFLVYQKDQPDDFELRLKFRIQGAPRANSGIQFRGSVHWKGTVRGYQADISRGGWLGCLWDEGTGRQALAKRGQKTVIAEDGKRETTQIGDAVAMFKNFDVDGWNDFTVIAKGHDITVKLNGQTTAQLTDKQKDHFETKGVLALQLHAGPPMTVQFKDVEIKALK
jgi:hypothetical protein